jgi:hypothetical protein
MGKATIVLEDDGDTIHFHTEFDPQIDEDGSEVTPAQAMAISFVTEIQATQLEQTLAPPINGLQVPEEEPQPEETDNGT